MEESNNSIDPDLVDVDSNNGSNTGSNDVGTNDNNSFLQQMIFELLTGGLGVVSSMLSVFIATFIGVTSISIQNGALLLTLTIFITILLIIRLANYYFNGRKKNVFICFIIILVNILAFVLKSIEFISIPLLIA